MQAIQTKYIGPSNVRGARVKAKCDASSITLGWDHRLNSMANHRAAAFALANKLGWEGVWTGGGIDAGYVFVLASNDQRDYFEIVAKAAA